MPWNPAALDAPSRQQAELAAPPDRLGTRCGLELSVGRGDLRLDGVPGDVQLAGDLTQRQVRREELQHADLRRGQRDRTGEAGGRSGLRDQAREPVGELVDLRAQHAFAQEVAEVLTRLLEPPPGGDRVAGLQGGSSQHDATCAPYQGTFSGEVSAAIRCTTPTWRRMELV